MTTTSRLFRFNMDGAFVGLGIRKQRKVMIEVHREMGLFWDKKYLPMHFRRGAGARYGYKKRALSTRLKKEKLAKRGKVAKGGLVDLVHTGLLEKSMLAAHSVRAYPSRVVINMPTTSYVSSRPRGNRPNMAAEITAVALSEAQEIARLSERVLQRETAKQIVDNRKTKKG